MELELIISTWYKIWFRTDRLYSEWARKRGLTYTSLFTLYVLHRTGGCTPQYISEFLAVSKQTVNSALVRFGEQGLIRREPSSTDGRSCMVYLNQQGLALANQIMEELSAMERRAFSRLTDEEIQRLVELSGRLADHIHQEMREDADNG